jgi:transglutaminase-like putative cysteine protease
MIKLFAKSKKKHAVENSVSLRIVSSAMAIAGILGACHTAETPLLLAAFSIFGTILGGIISYKRRNSNNFFIKWGLAFGVLILLGYFFSEIGQRASATIADAREPLTNLLIGLLALHSFDLPRRRDLNFSALVGLALLSSSATLSRNTDFGIFMLAYVLLGAYMLYLDSISRTKDSVLLHSNVNSNLGTTKKSQGKSQIAKNRHKTTMRRILLIGSIPILSLIIFAIMPKFYIGMLKSFQVSWKLRDTSKQTADINNPLLSKIRMSDGSLQVNPMAYFGFAEELDLNYRGELSKLVVMKVACRRGEYWRSMGFDTYDGHTWKMKYPKATELRTSDTSQVFLNQVPSLEIFHDVPTDKLTQVFYMEVRQPNLIPSAWCPVSIHFPTNAVEIDEYGALRSPVLLEKDTVYTVVSQAPRFDLNCLRVTPLPEKVRCERIQTELSDYLQLPDNLPPQIADKAAECTKGSRSWFNKAERIEGYVRLNHKYNLKIPPTPANVDTVYDFMFNRKEGYCEHYASAFVVMCRTQGIPARLVTGFQPGNYNPFTGLWEVKMSDAHAWAEIFVPYWGWVPFDPTPNGMAPGLAGGETSSVSSYINTQIQDLVESLSQNPQAKEALAMANKALIPATEFLQSSQKTLGHYWTRFLSAFALLLAAMFIFGACRLLLKAWRLGGPKPEKPHPAALTLLKLCSDLERQHLKKLPHETVHEFLSRLKKESTETEPKSLEPEAFSLLEKFMDIYSKHRFGPPIAGLAVQPSLESIRKDINTKLKTGRLKPASKHYQA